LGKKQHYSNDNSWGTEGGPTKKEPQKGQAGGGGGNYSERGGESVFKKKKKKKKKKKAKQEGAIVPTRLCGQKHRPLQKKKNGKRKFASGNVRKEPKEREGYGKKAARKEDVKNSTQSSESQKRNSKSKKVQQTGGGTCSDERLGGGNKSISCKIKDEKGNDATGTRITERPKPGQKK